MHMQTVHVFVEHGIMAHTVYNMMAKPMKTLELHKFIP